MIFSATPIDNSNGLFPSIKMPKPKPAKLCHLDKNRRVYIKSSSYFFSRPFHNFIIAFCATVLYAKRNVHSLFGKGSTDAVHSHETTARPKKGTSLRPANFCGFKILFGSFYHEQCLLIFCSCCCATQKSFPLKRKKTSDSRLNGGNFM